MAGYFIGMHRYFRMRKALLATASSAEFNTMALNSKISKVVSYIQDKKAWERIYVLLKILPPCLRTLRLAYSKRSGMDKVFYYSRITKIYIIKSSTDIDKNNYSQFLDLHLKRCGFHQIVTLKRKRILILMIQRVVIQICQKA